MEYRFFFKKLGLEMEVKIVFDDLVDVLFLLILFFEFLGLIEIWDFEEILVKVELYMVDKVGN